MVWDKSLSPVGVATNEQKTQLVGGGREEEWEQEGFDDSRHGDCMKVLGATICRSEGPPGRWPKGKRASKVEAQRLEETLWRVDLLGRLPTGVHRQSNCQACCHPGVCVWEAFPQAEEEIIGQGPQGSQAG